MTMIILSKILLTLFTSIALTALLVKFKDKINLMAISNHRTMHKDSIPNSGGIAIFTSFLISVFVFDITITTSVLIVLCFIFLVGIYDDSFESSAKQKIIALFIISNILFFADFKVEHLGTFLGQDIYISGLVSYLFLIFIVTGFVNSMNLIDGIDGLASMLGIIILGSFLYIGIKFNDEFLINVCLLYIFSILGYLFFNWAPAKIFMGDSGSLTLGLLITIVAIHSVNMGYITPISILLLAALPIIDTIIVMTRRIKGGESPFKADRNHIHHIILKQQRKNTKRTVIILSLTQLMFSYIGLGFKIKDDIMIAILFVIMILIIYMLLTSKTQTNRRNY